MRLFLDMDGVLADFDTGYERVFGVRPDKAIDNVEWDRVRAAKDFYLGLPPMPDFDELWNATRHYHPTILTGLPSSIPEAYDNKRAWVSRHCGSHVTMIGCPSKEKYLHGETGDILVDDWTKYRGEWIAMGGLFVHHINAESSLQQLRELGLALPTWRPAVPS